MLEFFEKLLDSSSFPPRWHCGKWSTFHGCLHIGSDLGIFLAYFGIPLILGFFVLRRKDTPFPGILWMFSAFILACGCTHLLEAIIFWWPAYRVTALVKLATALVSWITLLSLFGFLPRALAMRSPQELERIVAEQTATLERQRQLLEQLVRGIAEGVIGIDKEGNPILINRAAEEILGQSLQDAPLGHGRGLGRTTEKEVAAR